MTKPAQVRPELPVELRVLKQWITWFPKYKKDGISFTKPPKAPHKVNDPDTWITYDEAVAKDPEHIGLVSARDDGIIMIDVDHANQLQALPQKLVDLIHQRRPYIERSPSGNGFRIVFKINKLEKYALDKAYIVTRPNTFDGQISVHSNYQTITHDTEGLPSCTTLPMISLAELNEWFPVTAAEVIPLTKGDKTPVSQIPQFHEIQVIMSKYCTLDKNPRVVRAWESYESKAYVHYEYWHRIGMMLYDWGEKAAQGPQAFNLFIAWSNSDPDSSVIDSDEELSKKWSSFQTDSGDRLSYRSLVKLAKMIKFDWPYPVTVTVKGRRVPQPYPDIMEFTNYEYLIAYYNIKITRSVLGQASYFITSDEDILNKYFLPYMEHPITVNSMYGPIQELQLNAGLHLLCIQNDFRKFKTDASMSYLRHYAAKHCFKEAEKVDVFRNYVLTEAKDLPLDMQEGVGAKYRTLSDILNHITFQHWAHPNKHRYFEILKVGFMQMLKLHFYEGPYDENNIMPILSGPEKTYKTTFWKLIVPPAFRQFTRQNTIRITEDAAVRDASKLTSYSIMYIMDECERFGVNVKNDSTFKMFVSVDKPAIIDKYMVQETIVQRRALIVGTTNSDNLILGDYGTRRFGILPVSEMDTSIFDDFDWHHFYRDLYYNHYLPAIKEQQRTKAKDGMPWVLTKKQQDFLEESNTGVSAESSLDKDLRSLFDFHNYDPDLVNVGSIQHNKYGHFMSTQEIKAYIRQELPDARLDTNVLEHALSRVLGKATNSYKEERIFTRPKGILFKGKFMQGQNSSYTGGYKYVKWYVPPKTPITFAVKQDVDQPNELE